MPQLESGTALIGVGQHSGLRFSLLLRADLTDDNQMNRWLLQFWSGWAFLALGMLGRMHYSGAVPPADFRGHPLSAPEGGLVVELVGWIGVFAWILIALGFFFVVYTTQHGFKTGVVQDRIKALLPEKKAEEVAEGEGENEEGA